MTLDLDKLESLLTGPLSDNARAELLAAAPELIAAARMLDELMAKLPRCTEGAGSYDVECTRIATQQCDRGDPPYLSCDEHTAQEDAFGGTWTDLPWADIIRRRDGR